MNTFVNIHVVGHASQKSYLKGLTISDSFGLRNPPKIKKNTCPIFSQKLHEFDRQMSVFQTSSHGPWTLCLSIHLNSFYDDEVLCFSFKRTNKIPKTTILYLKKLSIAAIEKYTKTLENQDLNDFLCWLEFIIAGDIVIQNNKQLFLYQKYAVSERVFVWVCHTVEFSLNACA